MQPRSLLSRDKYFMHIYIIYAHERTNLALLRRLRAYLRSLGLKTMEEAAIAAEVSAAISLPAVPSPIFLTVLFVFICSGEIQHL